ALRARGPKGRSESRLAAALLLLGGALAYRDPDVDILVVALQVDRRRLARNERGDEVQHRVRVLHRFSFDVQQDVPGFQARLLGRTAAQHARDENAVGRGQPERVVDLGRDLLRLDADPAPGHAAGLDDLLHDLLGARRRYRETDPQRSARARIDRGVDADQIPGGVDERAARVAGIDRGVRLNEVLESVQADLAAERGDDPHRHGLPDGERVADREHDVAHAKAIGVAERDR